MIIKIYNSVLVILFILFIPYNLIAEDKIEHKIAVLVNEDIITSYDIIQRLKLTAIIGPKKYPPIAPKKTAIIHSDIPIRALSDSGPILLIERNLKIGGAKK